MMTVTKKNHDQQIDTTERVRKRRLILYDAVFGLYKDFGWLWSLILMRSNLKVEKRLAISFHHNSKGSRFKQETSTDVTRKM